MTTPVTKATFLLDSTWKCAWKLEVDLRQRKCNSNMSLTIKIGTVHLNFVASALSFIIPFYKSKQQMAKKNSLKCFLLVSISHNLKKCIAMSLHVTTHVVWSNFQRRKWRSCCCCCCYCTCFIQIRRAIWNGCCGFEFHCHQISKRCDVCLMDFYYSYFSLSLLVGRFRCCCCCCYCTHCRCRHAPFVCSVNVSYTQLRAIW